MNGGTSGAAGGTGGAGGTAGNAGSGAGGAAGRGAAAGRGGASGTGATAGTAATAGSTTGGNGGSSGTSGIGGAGGASGGSGGTAGTGGASGGSGGTAGTGGASGGSGGAAGTGGTSAGSGGKGGAGTGCDSADTCPFESGVAVDCRLRFMYGVNYAWQNFAADFGGGSRGVSATKSTIQTTLGTMADNGVNVVRWWVWPNFSGGGVSFDSSGTPTGLTSTTLADLEAALTLADDNGLYLMLTLFSFDNFKTSISPASQSLSTIALDATKRAALVNNVVRPFARAAAASAHAKRLIAWDVINEPEWAVTGASLYGGDQAFDPDSTCTPITHAQMETLLADVIAGLRQEGDALTTVGSAAVKWAHAWSMLDLDFYQFHIYDWVQQYYPYDRTPADYDIGDKPVVMGEFPPGGLTGVSYRTLLDSWYSNGYAGALAWRDDSYKVTWSDVKSFADAHPCETSF